MHLLLLKERKKDEKKDSGSKHIHPDRIEITCPSAVDIFS
jgi:hypothetical protein